MSPQAKWRREHAEAGLCSDCCEPATEGRRCRRHAAANRSAAKAAYQRKAREKAETQNASLVRCRCGSLLFQREVEEHVCEVMTIDDYAQVRNGAGPVYDRDYYKRAG